MDRPSYPPERPRQSSQNKKRATTTAPPATAAMIFVLGPFFWWLLTFRGIPTLGAAVVGGGAMSVEPVVEVGAVDEVVLVAVCAWAESANSSVPARRNAAAKSTLARTRRVQDAALITGLVHSGPAVCAQCAR